MMILQTGSEFHTNKEKSLKSNATSTHLKIQNVATESRKSIKFGKIKKMTNISACVSPNSSQNQLAVLV